MELKLAVIIPFFLFIFTNTNGDLLGSLRNLWFKPTAPPQPQTDGNKGGGGGSKFSSRDGYYDGSDPYMMSASGNSYRGWGWGGWGHDDHQNLDLYSLLGGLSFASLLGATIIYLARRNTSGRRRRSADGLSYVEEDDLDLDDPNTKGLNIIELIDSFLDNSQIFSGRSDEVVVSPPLLMVRQNDTNRASTRNNSHHRKVHLGPGLVPHRLIDSTKTN